MKHLKQNIHRLVATTLLVCFCLSTPATTYAMDGNVTSLNTQLQEWNGSRNSKGYGYKIQLFYATSNVDFHPGCDPMVYGVSLPTVYGFSSGGNPFTTVASPATEQVRVVPKELSIEDMGALKVTPEKLSVNVWDTAAIVASKSKIQTPGGDAICSAIGPPEVGLAATLRTQFKSDSPFLTALLDASTNVAGGDTSSLARKVYASIKDKDLKQEIGEKVPWSAPESTQNAALAIYVLPDSSECMVSWAAYVSPMRQTELTAGSKANPMLSPIFNNYMGTAHDYAYANGATRAAATQLLTLGKELEEARTAYATGSDAGAGAVNDITLAEESVIEKAIDGNQGNIEKMAREGEFGWQLNKIVYESLPNSLYNTEALWGVPVGSPKGSYDDPGIAYGMGIGLFWQDHKHAVQKTLAPCCEPVDWPAGVDYPTAYCPCGGEGSPRCKCGDKCNPEVFSCDCAQKKVEETVGNPLIDERHLAQLLQKTNFAKGSETVSMTYKPAPDTKDGFVRGEQVPGDSGGTVNGIFNNWPCTWYTCFVRPLKWETIKTPLAFSIPSDSYTLYSKMVNDPGSTGSKFALMQMDDKPLLRFDGGVEQFAVPMTQTVEQEDAKLGAHYQKELSAKWISHRWAIPGTQDTTVLAKYMAGEEANKAYKRFMDKAGCGPVKEANTYKTSPSNSNIASKFEMAFHIGDNEDLVVVPPNLVRPATYNPGLGDAINTGSELSLGIADGAPTPVEQNKHTLQCSAALEQAPPPVHEPNSIQSAILNKYECKTDVDVQAMYYGKPRTAVLYDKAPTASCGGGSATLTSPSSTFTFNPTYRMYADYDPAGTPSASNKDGAPVDMLGHVRRSARFQNKLNITCSIGKPDVIAPWSRDQEDLGVRTMKASNAYKYTQGATRIHAVGTFYLLDPDFTENPGTQKKINDLVMRQYVQQFEQLGTGFSSSNIQLETQLYNATSVSPKQKGGTGKEALYLEDKDGSGVSVNTATVNLPGNGFVTVAGKGYGGRGDSNSLLVANLQTGGGNKVKDWYNEDFDGIQEVTLTATFGVGPLETGYASVHPRQSDWQTKSESYKITPVVSIGSVSWGEASLSNVQFRPTSTSFNVRGSVFDTVN